MYARSITLLLCLCGIVAAQTVALEEKFFYDGGGGLEYVCTADANTKKTSTFSTTASQSSQPFSTIGTVSLTSISVTGNVATATTTGAHGYDVGQRITVSGATVDGDLNGSYTLATVTATTFTFAVANVSAATYTEAGLKFTSTAPRTNAAVWTVEKFFNTVAVLNRHIWARGDGSRNWACDDRVALFQ